MITVVLTERQAASIAAGLAAIIRKETITKEDMYFLTANHTVVPLSDDDNARLKDLFAKASLGVVDQPPPEPTKSDASQVGMRMRG